MGFFDKALKTAQNIGDSISTTAVKAGSSAGVAAQDTAELNSLKMQINVIEQELNAAYAQIGKKYAEEKTKLDRALAMDVISQDEYNFKISVARKKVDNFEEIRRVEQQCEMGIISKEERNAKIEALTK